MPNMDEIKKAYEEAKANQVEYSKNPGSAEAKKTARRAGLLMIGIGLLFAGVAYAFVVGFELERVPILLLVLPVGLVGFGLYVAAVGKMPKGK